MERVAVLINKLQEQLAQNASIQSMLVTVQLLQAQLFQESKQSNGHTVSLVSVMVPNAAKFERPVAGRTSRAARYAWARSRLTYRRQSGGS